MKFFYGFIVLLNYFCIFVKNNYMGGNALKNTYTERKNTEEFLRIGKEIQNKILIDMLLESVILKCYHTKADHGDLDLLIKITPDLNINWKTYIQTAFNPNEIYSNGGVYSFDYQKFQIDLIPIKEESWIMAQTYGFFDPLPNIMGKTFHKFGLSYGWEGLFYKFRNFHGTNSQDILLTNDARKIFDFGGYDYDKYLQGFETLEDILKFTINSKYFDTQIFQMNNLKSIDKKRNRKRGSYHIFLKYLIDNNINIEHNFHKDKDLYFSMIDEAFPEVKFLEKLKELKKIDIQNKIISQKFNGDIVMSWLPNLQGRELGVAITKFRTALGDDYKEFILNSEYKTIYDNFMEIYND